VVTRFVEKLKKRVQCAVLSLDGYAVRKLRLLLVSAHRGIIRASKCTQVASQLDGHETQNDFSMMFDSYSY